MTYPITCTEGTFAFTTYTIATYTDVVLMIVFCNIDAIYCKKKY